MAANTESLITLAEPRSPGAEAYRTLRTNIQFYSLDDPVRTVLVTSASAQEGKSTTISNLAVTFAQAGQQVILVDSDLRRPALHTYFGVKMSPGLSNVVRDDSDPIAALQATSVPGLRLLASGELPPNPSELIGAQRMGRIISDLRQEADIVLFDSPPIVAVTDAAILSRKVDGVVLVVSIGQTKRDHAVKAREILETAKVRVLGAVLNNVKMDSSLHRYYSS